MGKRKIPFGLIILCIIVIMFGGIWGAHTAGIINVKTYLGQVPYLNKYVYEEKSNSEINIPAMSPVEKENQQLKETKIELQESIKNLENKILSMENEKTKLMAEIESQQKEMLKLEEYKAKKEQETINLNELALYYKNMKADAIVKVMNNLDDDTVINLLVLLEEDQVSKILALMEPERAALITQILLHKGITN